MQLKSCPHCGKSFPPTVYQRCVRFTKYCSSECWRAVCTKHGHTVRGSKMTPTYNTWVNMIGRCTRPYHPGYGRYGAKGVTVCDRWMTFKNFLADMGERPDGMTLDRKDGAKGYYKGNCRWATICEQQGNTKSNVMVAYQGRTQCVSAWARELGIEKSTLAYRIERGWGDKAFTVAPRLGNRIIAKA